MVATRRSLGGDASQAQGASPQLSSTADLSKAQRAALKKLNISGTDALKGDPKAAAAAKEGRRTYHYRGAVYVADDNTPAEWIENQPKRYLKRERDGSEDDEDEEEEEPQERPSKRRKSSTKDTTRGDTATPSAERLPVPGKRKATASQDDDTTVVQMNTTPGTDGRKKRARFSLNNADVANPDSTRPKRPKNDRRSLPDQKSMDETLKRSKDDAKRKHYQVAPLELDDGVHGEFINAKVVALAKAQLLLNWRMSEYKQVKALRDSLLKKTAGEGDAQAEAQDQIVHEDEDTGEQQGNDQDDEDTGANFQVTIDAGHAQNEDDDLVGEQWEREQELEIPESPPEIRQVDGVHEPKKATEHATGHKADNTAGHTTNGLATPAQTTTLAGTNAGARPTTRGNTTATAGTQHTPSSGSTHASARSRKSTESFSHLPPNAALPQASAGGDPLRWTISRSSRTQADGENKDEYAYDLARLEGESKSARRRRVERERSLVEGWAKLTGGVVKENK